MISVAAFYHDQRCCFLCFG